MKAEIEFTFATPTSIGWHDPFVLDDLWLARPTAIKGLWRWWARAVVAGLMYEEGCLQCRGGRPAKQSAEELAKHVGKSLGLGYAGGEEASASKYTIRVEVKQRPRTASNVQNLNRVKLLTLGKPRNEAEKIYNSFVIGGIYSLKITARDVDDKQFQAAVGTLILALTLGGLGKGSRKGLGSVDIIRIAADKPLDIDITKRRSVREYAEVVLGAVREVLQLRRCGPAPAEPPCIPAFTRAKCPSTCPKTTVQDKSYGAITAECQHLTEIYEVEGVGLEVLHNFFLRGERARRVAGHFRNPDPLRGSYSKDAVPRSYVLGLPREQKGTGYEIAGDATRRASTIMLAYHGQYLGGRRNVGVVTIIKSMDWPPKLEWRGGAPPGRAYIPPGGTPLYQDACEVMAAYEIAKEELLVYVQKARGKAQRVWP